MTTIATAADLMTRLRRGTRADHDATESVPFSSAMVEQRLPRRLYIRHLHSMSVVHQALEDALRQCDDPAVGSIWSEDLAKTPLLERDLSALGACAPPACDPAMLAADNCAREINDVSANEPATLLGFLYVLEGSTLGAAILRKHLAAMYNIDASTGLAYYSPYGNAVMPHWQQFKAAMNAADLSETQMQRIISAARRMFTHIGAILTALSTELDEAH